MNRLSLFVRFMIGVFTLLSLGGAVGGVELFTLKGAAAAAHEGVGVVTAIIDQATYSQVAFSLAVMICVTILYEGISTRNRPITVLASELHLQFLDGTGHKVRVSRTQYLKANQPNVTAYYMSASTEFGGDITEVTGNAFCNDRKIENTIDIPPTVGRKKVEIAHMFNNGMPFGLLNILIPNFVLRILIKNDVWSLPHIVKRTMQSTYLDEHILPRTYFQVSADRYIQHNITIDVTFDQNRPPKLGAGQVLQAALIARNGVTPIYFHTNDGLKHRKTFRHLRDAKIRIPLEFEDPGAARPSP